MESSGIDFDFIAKTLHDHFISFRCRQRNYSLKSSDPHLAYCSYISNSNLFIEGFVLFTIHQILESFKEPGLTLIQVPEMNSVEV